MHADGAAAPRRIGRYELFQEFARGGMASVHLGRMLGPVGFSRTVAIKRLLPSFTGDADVVRMFVDEARIAARVRHPNVVPVLDVVALAGELYIVMDYVQGASLATLLAETRQLEEMVPLPIALNIAVAILAGLHAAHEATGERGEALHIVHRDMSPQNVLVGEDGVARVLDFGVAKAANRLGATIEGQIKGKLGYMSPEQLKGQNVERASDVFSAGIVVWEMLAGKRLVTGDNPGALVVAMMNKTFEPPSVHNSEVPPELDAVVLKSMAREPADRFASALEFMEALEHIGPQATVREVGAWVKSRSGDKLAAIAAAVAAVESVSVVTSRFTGDDGDAAAATRGDPAHVAGAGAGPRDAATKTPRPEAEVPSVLATVAEPPRERRSWHAAAVVAALAIAILAFVGLRGRFAGTADAGPKTEATASESATSDAPAPPTSAPPTEASAATASAVAPSAEPQKVPPPPRHGPFPKGGRTKPGASAPVPPADCRIVNPDGTIGYRPECLK